MTDFEPSSFPLEFPFEFGITQEYLWGFPLDLGFVSDSFEYTFPITLGGYADVRLMSTSGQFLNNSLQPGTYFNFGTIAKGNVSYINAYVTNIGDRTMSAVKLETVEREGQAGRPVGTTEATYFQYDTDVGSENWSHKEIEIGAVLGFALKTLRVKWAPPGEAFVGLKLWYLQISGNYEVY